MQIDDAASSLAELDDRVAMEAFRLHDPADAARAEAFEAFAGALRAPGLNRACVALLARVAALHLRVKASESRPPVADLGGVLRRLFPKAAAA